MPIFICRGFDRTATCRSDTNYSSAVFFCMIDLLCCFFCNLEKFRMHMMFCDLIYLHRSESSKPDMQCHTCDIHAFLLNRFQKLRCKMQSCCRRCCRAVMLRINSLITVLILQLMCDVRRKRHLAKLVKDLFKNPFISKPYQTISLLYNIYNFSDQKSVTEADLRSDFCLFPRFYKCLPGVVAFSF